MVSLVSIMNGGTDMADILKINSWIGNKEVTADKYRDDTDPGKIGELIAQTAQGTDETVDLAAKTAAEAQPAWAALSVEKRKEYINKLLKVTQDSLAELSELEAREAGHELRTAQLDFGIAAGALQYYNAVIDKFMESEVIEDDSSWTRIDKVPKGVCAGIVPWNMPICLTMSKLPLALLTGNTMIVKPPSDAPAALSILMQRYAKELPDGVLNVVNGSGAKLSKAITSHPLIRKVGFTGGTEGGRDVYIGCAQNLKTATLELGGNDAAVLLDDIDMDEVIPKLMNGIFDRAGQICFAIKRVYVPSKMIDKFYDKMCEYVDANITTGYQLDENAFYGPLMNKTQYEHILGLIEEAKGTSSVVRELGKNVTPDLDGYYVRPHVVKASSNDISIVSCEQFGPCIPVIPYDTEEQALEFANGTRFGLCSSVWSSDQQRGIDFAKDFQAGQTFVNGHSMFALTFGVPFGGFKDSGVGREFTGDLSLNAYVDYHAVRLMK
jgi:acyl-CoA reductase-like NAD-dependent aldehyde dehydrogenase